MHRTLSAILFSSCLVFCCSCLNLAAQVLKGSISGTVVDAQGAVVPNAQVKATNALTTTAVSTKTDSAGLFRFNLIPAGTYKVEVTATGFKTAVRSDVQVSAGVDSGLGDISLWHTLRQHAA